MLNFKSRGHVFIRYFRQCGLIGFGTFMHSEINQSIVKGVTLQCAVGRDIYYRIYLYFLDLFLRTSRIILLKYIIRD